MPAIFKTRACRSYRGKPVGWYPYRLVLAGLNYSCTKPQDYPPSKGAVIFDEILSNLSGGGGRSRSASVFTTW